jgi:micrococcal nuclease
MNQADKRRLYGSISVLVFLASAGVYLVWNIGRLFPVRVHDAAVVHSVQDNNVSIPVSGGRSVRVVRAIDGDTLDIQFADSGERAHARLIGVNTPESVDPRKPVQCFGKEASAHTAELVAAAVLGPGGSDARIITDPTQGVSDKYNRFLVYVYLPDGSLLNERIIADGYGFEYTYRTPYALQARFKVAEQAAKAAGRGLWAAQACNANL